jgi:hypothetical protein
VAGRVSSTADELVGFQRMRNLTDEIIWNEFDVIGQMCVNNSIKQALISGVVADDFNVPIAREIYKEIVVIADRVGRFKTNDLLKDEKIERNKHVLNMMNNCLSTNLDVKCNWIVELSVRRRKSEKNKKRN